MSREDEELDAVVRKARRVYAATVLLPAGVALVLLLVLATACASTGNVPGPQAPAQSRAPVRVTLEETVKVLPGKDCRIVEAASALCLVCGGRWTVGVDCWKP